MMPLPQATLSEATVRQLAVYAWNALLHEVYEQTVALLHIPRDGALFAVEDNRIISSERIMARAQAMINSLVEIKPLVQGQHGVYTEPQSLFSQGILYCNLLNQDYPSVTKQLKEALLDLMKGTRIKRKSRSMRFSYPPVSDVPSIES